MLAILEKRTGAAVVVCVNLTKYDATNSAESVICDTVASTCRALAQNFSTKRAGCRVANIPNVVRQVKIAAVILTATSVVLVGLL
jgi:hypothetical protein